jgi:hypothetical protein
VKTHNLLGLGLVLGFFVAGCGSEHSAAPSHVQDASPEGKMIVTQKEVETPSEVIAQVTANLNKSVILRDVVPNPNKPNPGNGGGLGIGPIKISEIVNIGKQVWDIIKENRGVAEVSVDFANGLPMGITNVQELSGFSNLQFKSYQITGGDWINKECVKINYTLVHQYNGNYQGQGQYLSTVSVIPSKIEVSWGCKANFKVSSVMVSNVGTMEAPVANAIMMLELVMDSHTTDAERVTKLIEFRGDSATPISQTL